MKKIGFTLAAALLMSTPALAKPTVTNAVATFDGKMGYKIVAILKTDQNDQVVNASSSIGAADVHTVVRKGKGSVMLRHPITTQAGVPLLLKTSGRHLMVMPSKPLHKGDHFDYTVTFAKAGDVKTKVTIQ